MKTNEKHSPDFLEGFYEGVEAYRRIVEKGTEDNITLTYEKGYEDGVRETKKNMPSWKCLTIPKPVDYEKKKYIIVEQTKYGVVLLDTDTNESIPIYDLRTNLMHEKE